MFHKLDSAVNSFELWALGLPIDNFICCYSPLWDHFFLKLCQTYYKIKPLRVAYYVCGVFVKMWPESISDKRLNACYPIM